LFGSRGELRRRLGEDRSVAAAAGLVADAPSQAEVFKRAAERYPQQQPSSR
jgi:hypothetical protein